MIRHFLIKPEKMEPTMRWGGLLMFPGLALVGIGFLGVPFGCFPGMMTILYAASCGTFWKTYRKRRMWLLALAFGVVLIPCYLLLTWVSLVAEPGTLPWAIDLLLGTTILGMTVKLLVSVVVYNRRVSRALAVMRQEGAQPVRAG